MRERLALTWDAGPSNATRAADERRVPATVPGAVQLDWARALGWPDPHVGENVRRFNGLEQRWWLYRATVPEFAANGREAWLVLEGVDHAASVWINGAQAARALGMQSPTEVRVQAGDKIEVLVEPAPREPGATGRARARRTTKAAVSYGWDFHPEAIPLGLCRPAYIELRPAGFIRRVRFRYRLAADLSEAGFRIKAESGAAAEAVLVDPEGRIVWNAPLRGGRAEGRLPNPRLWWPAGQGAQDRYILRIRAGEDVVERRVGFRRVRLVMAPGEWDEPSAFPKSRSRPPMRLEVNGRPVFAKGANVVPPEMFPGRVTGERLRALVAAAAGANMNLLRVWGGGPALEEAFYDACDERGVMVLQDFPLACNDYPDDPAYLAELDGVARALLARLSAHPCLAVWSGGNELCNAWSGMTDQSHALRLLAARCWEEDPDTPFVPTMPVEGVGHGYYLFRDPRTGEECFSMFRRARNTGYTEFGVPGPAPAAVIRAIIPGAERVWPPEADPVWTLHGGFHAWDVEPTSYLCLSTIEHYWGAPRDLDDLVARGHWLEAEGLRAIIEEARRQRPVCGWALVWCLNEPWPMAANQSLLAYPDVPKPALAATGAAMRPTLASARLPRFQWAPGERFEAELWLLHDAPGPRPSCRVTAWLSSGGWRRRLLEWEAEAGPADTDLAGPTARCDLPAELGGELVLELETDDPALASTYRLATRAGDGAAGSSGPRGLNT